jgi:hypothetical protein
MLQVDFEASNFHIERFIEKSCSVMGHVISVKFHRSPTPFALIQMGRQEQTYDLAARYGGSTFGTCALVHLEQIANSQSGQSTVAA